MKKVILLLTLLLFATIGWSQTTFYTAQHSTIRYYNSVIEQWNDWEEWNECNITITVNLDRDEINIYSQRVQEYVILSYSQVEKKDNFESVTLNALDEEGIRCNIKLIKYINGESHIYVQWSDMQLGYQVVLR
jgi:uncharacterized protein YxeA